METIKCTFYRPEQVDIAEFQQIVGKLAADYEICRRNGADLESLRSYADALLAQAKPLKHNPKMYFLGLDDPENMPSDARIDFFYRPTYLGTAIIMHLLLTDDSLLSAPEKKKTFRGMLLGCTSTGFAGHGYDGLQEMIATMHIFAANGADRFLKKYPQFSPEFTATYNKCLQEIKDRLKTNTVQNFWGEDYTTDAEAVINLSNAHS